MNNMITSGILASILIAALFAAVIPLERASTIHPRTLNGGSIADGSVTATKLGDNAVTSLKISDGTIGDADISGTAAIGLGKLATGALPAGITVASSNVPGGAISESTDFAGGVVDSQALADAISLPTSLTVGGTGTSLSVIKTGTFSTPSGIATTSIVNDADATTAAIIAISCNADVLVGWRIVVDGVDDAGDGDATVDFQVIFLADPSDGVPCDYLLVRP